MILQNHLRTAIEKLRLANIETPDLDARLLLGFVLNLSRADLLSQSARLLTPDEMLAFETAIARRCAHEPVSRIIGHREFWGLTFGLNEATLDPRPDSETLIETCLSLYPEGFPTEGRILDLGTGTGCLLLALLSAWPTATGVGVDIAPRAIAQATENAKSLNLADRATFRVQSWLDGEQGVYDLIISNPPYIETRVVATLAPEVRDYDPYLALDGGEDGLSPYAHLIPRLPASLKPAGWSVFEIGAGQDADVCALFQKNGFTKTGTNKDLNGILRCVYAQKKYN